MVTSGEKKGVCHQDKWVSYGRLSKMWTFLSENEGNLLEELLTSRPVYYLPTFFPPTTYLNFIQFLLIPFLREMTEPRLVYTMDQLICFAWRQRPELELDVKHRMVSLVGGSIALLSHFAKCKNQKCQFQILQEIAFGTSITNTKKNLCKIFLALHFKV